jgi:hypothetical protein
MSSFVRAREDAAAVQIVARDDLSASLIGPPVRTIVALASDICTVGGALMGSNFSTARPCHCERSRASPTRVRCEIAAIQFTEPIEFRDVRSQCAHPPTAFHGAILTCNVDAGD